MSRIVNGHNAPHAFIEFCEDDHYDAGRSDYSATTLINEPKIVRLEKDYPELVVDDPFENPFKFLSSNWHEMLSAYQKGPTINEERIFTEIVRPIPETRPVVISGAMDVQTITDSTSPDYKKDVVIGDYKMTSVYALKDVTKFEQQLNIYAYLTEKEKPSYRVTGLEIYAFLRDWKISMSEKLRDYPATPGITIELELWTYEERERFIEDRIELHENAKRELPDCSEEGRWPAGKLYRVFSLNDSHRSKTFSLKRDANKFIASLDPVDALMTEVQTTHETYRRCKSYCYFSSICDQWKESQENND